MDPPHSVFVMLEKESTPLGEQAAKAHGPMAFKNPAEAHKHVVFVRSGQADSKRAVDTQGA